MASVYSHRSRLVNAALAAWQGDLGPAQEWFTILGRTITRDQYSLHVAGTSALPAGGIIAGGDPLGQLVQVMLLTAGTAWTQLPESRLWMREVNDMFRESVKAQKQGSED